MFIEFIQDHVGQLGKNIPAGTQCHKLNDAAKLLISQGVAKAVVDPEDYSPYPLEETETSEKEPIEPPIKTRKTISKPPIKRPKQARKTITKPNK